MKLLRSLRNDHHWQWWILPEDDGGTKILPMSRDARLELIADWIGAGMAISGRKDPWPWYQENKDKVNRLKALGNGQVPLCAVAAWEILIGKEKKS